MDSTTDNKQIPLIGVGGEAPLGKYTGLCNPPPSKRGKLDQILYNKAVKMIEAEVRDNYLLRAIWHTKQVYYMTKHPEEFSKYQTKKKGISFKRDLFCGHSIGNHVDIRQTTESGSVVFAKTAMCGANWVCPTCAAKIHAVRNKEVSDFVKFIDKQNGLLLLDNDLDTLPEGLVTWRRKKIVMLTLTAPHNARTTTLAEFGRRISEALRKLQNSKVFKRLMRKYGLFLDMECKYKGYIRVAEYTHSHKNGWHKHFHILLVLDDDADCEIIEDELKAVWVNSCLNVGLCANTAKAMADLFEHGLKLSNHGLGSAEDIAKYVAKSGGGVYAVLEIASASTKEGRFVPGCVSRDLEHRTPNQIALDMVLYDTDDKSLARDRHALAEYMFHTHASAQMYWAKGLKAVCGIKDIDDKQAVEEYLEGSAAICGLTVAHWYEVSKRIDQSVLKEAASKGVDAVQAYFDSLGIEYELPPIITADEVDLLMKYENQQAKDKDGNKKFELSEDELARAEALMKRLNEVADKAPVAYQGGCDRPIATKQVEPERPDIEARLAEWQAEHPTPKELQKPVPDDWWAVSQKQGEVVFCPYTA